MTFFKKIVTLFYFSENFKFHDRQDWNLFQRKKRSLGINKLTGAYNHTKSLAPRRQPGKNLPWWTSARLWLSFEVPMFECYPLSTLPTNWYVYTLPKRAGFAWLKSKHFNFKESMKSVFSYCCFTRSPNFELCGWLFFLTIFEKNYS